MSELVLHCIAPVFDARSRVLMLGSIPSPKSREEGFFYGHPRNRFWSVLAAVFDEPVPRSIADKRDLLLRHHIALWDVAAACTIDKASDASIRDVVPNDLGAIFEAADIRAVLCTGTKAGELYTRFCERRFGMPCTVLPSTSPANAKASFSELVEAYGAALLDRLEPFEPAVLDVEEVAALERKVERDGTPLAVLMERAGRFLAYETMKLAERRCRSTPAAGCTPQEPDENASPGIARGTHAGNRREGGTEGLSIASRRTDRDADGSGRKEKPGGLRCVVLCGTGNNGGDGWVAAAELDTAGCDVTVASPTGPDGIAAQPAHAAAVRAAAQLRESPHARILVDPNAHLLHDALDGADAIVDALLGTGFSEAHVRPPLDAWIEAANARRTHGAFIVAADVPSGLSARTGKAAAPCIKADATVTIIAPKPGVSTPYAFALCGEVRVAPLCYREEYEAGGAMRPNGDEKRDAGGTQALSDTPGRARPHGAPEQRAFPEEKDRASRTDTPAEARLDASNAAEKQAGCAVRGASGRAKASGEAEFLRAEAEDDDGYDPYSDRKPEPEPLFQQDPWA